MLAVQGVLAALWSRLSTGRGDRVTVNMVDAVMAFLMRQDLARNQPPPATSVAQRRGIDLCFLRPRCRDGRYLQMCARQDRNFLAWLDAIGLGEMAQKPQYRHGPMHIPTVEDADALEAAIRAAMIQETSEHWMKFFTENYDVGADPFLNFDEFLEHPQMLENERVLVLDDPQVGPVRQVGPLALFSETPSRIETTAPRLAPLMPTGKRVKFENKPPPPTSNAGVRSQQIGQPGRDQMDLPLRGVTILELAYFVAGPLAGTLLAELGARVIKVEPLDGDPFRRAGLQAVKFLQGKESLALDLKRPEGQSILSELVRRSDVLIHSFRGDAPRRLGMSYEQLKGVNPSLLYVQASSYGSKGPQSGRTAFHSTPNALCGGGILQAGDGNAPVDDSFADPGSALGVATAVLLGLHSRRLLGRGQTVETTMLASSGYTMSPYLTRHEAMPPDRFPDQGQHGFHALYRLYPCADGWVFLSCQKDEEWERLARALGEESLLQDERFTTREARRAHDDELIDALARRLAGDSANRWEQLLRKDDVPIAAVTEVTQDIWLEKGDYLEPGSHPLFGDYWLPKTKIHFDRHEPTTTSTAAVGEHSREILTGLGLTIREIDDLEASGIIRSWQR